MTSRERNSFSPITHQESIFTHGHVGFFEISVKKYVDLSQGRYLNATHVIPHFLQILHFSALFMIYRIFIIPALFGIFRIKSHIFKVIALS